MNKTEPLYSYDYDYEMVADRGYSRFAEFVRSVGRNVRDVLMAPITITLDRAENSGLEGLENVKPFREISECVGETIVYSYMHMGREIRCAGILVINDATNPRTYEIKPTKTKIVNKATTPLYAPIDKTYLIPNLGSLNVAQNKFLQSQVVDGNNIIVVRGESKKKVA